MAHDPCRLSVLPPLPTTERRPSIALASAPRGMEVLAYPLPWAAAARVVLGGRIGQLSRWNCVEWEELKDRRGFCFYFLGRYSKGRREGTN